MKPTELEIPGGVYLCQVSEHISCGACCGVYNVGHASRHSLQALLMERTAAFAGVQRNADAISAFADRQVQQFAQGPFPGFHHCPFVGLIGPLRSRIGCLLHPLADGNNEIDFRGLSYYGGMACRIYFCPSCHQLTAPEKNILRKAVSDWYTYGLIITESRLLKAFFREIEKRLTVPLAADRIVASRKCLHLVNEFLLLKSRWPFRKPQEQNPCNYFFEDRRYRRPGVNYADIGVECSCFDTFFECFGSHFSDRRQLRAAAAMLDGLLERVADSFQTVSALHRQTVL